jgi:hypothetical protein
VNALRGALRRLSVARSLLSWLWRERLWWMIPLLLALLLTGALVALSLSPVAPFVYTLF